MNVRYRVELSQVERAEPTAMLGGGEHAACKLKRSQAADAGSCDAEIARSVRVSLSSIGRTKRRFEGNLERALSEEPRPGAERKLRSSRAAPSRTSNATATAINTSRSSLVVVTCAHATNNTRNDKLRKSYFANRLRKRPSLTRVFIDTLRWYRKGWCRAVQLFRRMGRY